MIDVESIDCTVKTLICVKVSGAPEHKADYMDRMIQPDKVLVEYRYRELIAPDGWTEHVWAAIDVRIEGPRVLKPGPDGAQRLGAETHSARWSNFDVRGGIRMVYPSDRAMPEWLVKLVNELRPSGQVELPGGAA